MSICLLAIPVALAMRVVMGEKKFDAWIESNTVRFATNFQSDADLVRTVKQAGFDADPWGKQYKTHIDENLWFLWEYHENKWQANFSKSDDTDKIRRFFKTLQQRANRQILYVAPQTQRIEPKVEQSLPTIYTDGALLMGVLQKYGAQPTMVNEKEVSCVIDGVRMNFKQASPETPYEMTFVGKKDAREVYDTLRKLDEGYQGAVQERTYLAVKKKLEERRLNIEDEEILEDNSIVLTISL